MDRASRKICVTLLRYNVDKPESSYVQVRLSERKKEDEKFKQVVFVDNKFDEFIYLFDVMKFVYGKVNSNQPVCNGLEEVTLSFYTLSFFSIRVKMSWNIEDNRNHFLKLKSKLGLCHVVLTSPNTSPENLHWLQLKCNNCQILKRLIPKKKYLA